MIDVLGWAGAAVALGCYFALASGRVSVRVFHWSEFLAAFPLVASALHHDAFPAVVVTSAYAFVGLYGIVWGTR